MAFPSAMFGLLSRPYSQAVSRPVSGSATTLKLQQWAQNHGMRGHRLASTDVYQSHALRNFKINRLFTRSCLGIGLGIYAAWNFSQGGLLHQMYEKLQREQGTSIKSATGISLPPARNTPALSNVLNSYFIMRASEPYNMPSIFGASLSHRDFFHMLFNFLTWSSFAPALYALPPVHTTGLIIGSALASAGFWMYTQKDKPFKERRRALGSSGIVSGVLATVTMIAPFARARAFGIVPAPLFVMTGAWFALDTYFMVNEGDGSSNIGHAAHLGGGAFGVSYYLFMLRRFRGI